MEDSETLPEALTTTRTVAAVTQTTSSTSTSKKKRKKRTPKPHVLSQFTIRDSPWAYIHLERLSSSGIAMALDEVTAQLNLTSALSQFLGLHGAAIPFDILKLDGEDVWIRLPAEDRTALIAAVGGWISKGGEGWRVKGWSSWTANAMGRDGGQDLFTD